VKRHYVPVDISNQRVWNAVVRLFVKDVFSFGNVEMKGGELLKNQAHLLIHR
jgi:hypothetical protein